MRLPHRSCQTPRGAVVLRCPGWRWARSAEPEAALLDQLLPPPAGARSKRWVAALRLVYGTGPQPRGH
eukprot:3275985-Pyramimonas_sp.AAC.1